MKRRVLASWSTYRLVGDGGQYGTRIEVSDGRDAMGVTRWREVREDEWAAKAQYIFRDFALSLHRKERAARRAKYRRTGK